MAAPYPPNPYGPGAGMQPPQRPMMPTGPQRVKKRGVSKAVPVVVSAGLAVGVFCGLLFGLGTGETSASAGPSRGNNLKASAGKESVSTPGAAPAGVGAIAAVPPPKPATPDAGAALVAAGSAAGSATAASGTGSAAAGPAAPTVAAAGSGAGSAVAATKITIEVEPAAAATIAKITVDGKDITGSSIEVTPDKKSVKVSVSATGYHSVDKKIDVVAGTEMKVQLELTKRASGGSPGFGGASTTPNRVPTAPPKPKKPPNSGIIDI